MIVGTLLGAVVAVVGVAVIWHARTQRWPVSSNLADSDRIECRRDGSGRTSTIKEPDAVRTFVGILRSLESGWRENPFVKSEQTVWCNFYRGDQFRGGVGIGTKTLYYVPSVGGSRELPVGARENLLNAVRRWAPEVLPDR